MHKSEIMSKAYPVFFYSLVMPLISGIGSGIYACFDMFSDPHSFNLITLIFMCGVFTMGAYVFGSVASAFAGLTVSLSVCQPKYQIVFFASIVALLVSGITVHLYSSGVDGIVFICAVFGTLCTSLMYFKTENFKRLSKGG